MDADDIMHKDKILLQIKFMLKNKLDFCGTWIKFFGNENKTIKYPVSDIDIRYFMVFGCPFAHPSIILKKEILKKNKYVETIAEDYHLWTRVAKSPLNYKFGNLPKVLLKYRRHYKQLSYDNTHIIKDSIKISNEYSAFYINDKNILEVFTSNNFGMYHKYEFFDFYKLFKSMILLAKKNMVSNDILLRLIVSIFNRTNNTKFYNLIEIFNFLVREKVSLFNTNILKILIIFLLRKLNK